MKEYTNFYYKRIEEIIIREHEKVNQYYDENNFDKAIPYSFHLIAVKQSGFRFFKLLEEIIRVKYPEDRVDQVLESVFVGLLGHDLIEDTSLTYNDTLELFKENCREEIIAKDATEIIYLVTDYKGRNRAERKPPEYYKALKENFLAVFVKLSDMTANMTYGKLFDSSMYYKYKEVDYPKLKKECYFPEFELIYEYMDSL